MKNKSCPKCYVSLVAGVALMNPIGKINSKGQFIPESQCGDHETIYPVTSKMVMIPVDKCPSCGYSVTEL